MIIIMGHISTEPELVHDLVADLRAGLERSRAEDGCLFYSFTLDDADAGTVHVGERWRDEESLAAHLSTPEIGEMLGRWVGKISLDVRKFDASNERGMDG